MAKTKPHKDLGPDAETRIVSLMRAGGTVASITAELVAAGAQVSPATVHRRMRSLRSRVNETRKRAPTRAAELPTSADEIPTDADMVTLDKWLKIADRMGQQAEIDGDLSALAAAGRLSASLLEAKRKATPVRPPDPNENPDMMALGADVAARLTRMLEDALS